MTQIQHSEQLRTALTGYRNEIRSFMLGDGEDSVYERLNGLFALPRAGTESLQRYSSRIVEHMQRAEHRPIMLHTLGGLAVGYLQRENPWGIASVKSSYNTWAARTEHDLALTANFDRVRIVSHSREIYGVGYGGGGSIVETGADVSGAESSNLIVNLGSKHPGDENFARRLEEIPQRLAIGWDDIHGHVNDMELSDGRRAALRIAVTMAAAALGPMPE